MTRRSYRMPELTIGPPPWPTTPREWLFMLTHWIHFDELWRCVFFCVTVFLLLVSTLEIMVRSAWFVRWMLVVLTLPPDQLGGIIDQPFYPHVI